MTRNKVQNGQLELETIMSKLNRLHSSSFQSNEYKIYNDRYYFLTPCNGNRRW